VRGFLVGALLNFMLLVHVLFVAEDEHLDVIFVSTVGLSLGVVGIFLLLGHRVITNDRASNARYWVRYT
jgi:hypothetical protein